MLRFKDGGVYVSVDEVAAAPHVQWNHIDGPLMIWCGELHWLTWRERLCIALGIATERDVAYRRWPHLAKLHTTYKRLGELPPATTVRLGE
jgi:hypothetical protein